MPSFKKSLIVEQFQGNYLKDTFIHLLALCIPGYFYAINKLKHLSDQLNDLKISYVINVCFTC